jgi:NADP-dependent aldehyde dehydrogenase
VHGGPYPATTAASATSVGLTAARRFQRPVGYQGWPDGLLPAELQDANPLGIVRLVDGVYTRDPVRHG